MASPMQSRHTAAGIIAGNDDILMEILLNMPAKSLMKFKSVSKHWLSLLSSFHFSRRHTLRHRSTTTTSAICLRKPTSNHCLIFLRRDNNSPPKVQTFQFNLTPKFNPASKILQSCNGLFLLQVCPNDKNSLISEYYIYNPATSESRFLPIKGQSRVLGLCLGYDPSKSVTHYKVICVKVATFPLYEIEVYDSESHSWNLWNGGKGVVMPRDIKLSDGVYWNGNIHWIRPKGKIFCLDLEKECVVEFPGIEIQRSGSWNMWRNSGRIGNSNGHLYFITLCRSLLLSSEELELQIFETGNDYSKGWFLKYKVKFDDILCEFPGISSSCSRKSNNNWDALDFCDFCVVGMVRGEKEEESLLVFHVPGKVVGYKFEDGSFVELSEFREGCFYGEGCFQFGGYDVACEFIETLAPV